MNDPVAVVKDFLAAIVARDLDRANQLVSSDFVMIANGNQQFAQLRDFVASSKARQKSVTKHPDSFELLQDTDGDVVYCLGTMSGQWLDGSAYSDVRFVDRFVIRAGSICSLQVWSDMAEFRPHPKSSNT